MSAHPRRTLGQTIRARRQELGLTQEDLADRIGPSVGQNYVSQLERDRVKLPRQERLRAIADILGIEAGELLERSGWTGASARIASSASAPATVAPADDAADAELADLWGAMSPEQRHSWIDFGKYLARQGTGKRRSTAPREKAG